VAGGTTRAILCVLGLACAPAAVASEVAAVAEAARGAAIVVLGEVHDNPAHHANQAAIVAALQPDALVFEMIPRAAEDAVNALRDDRAGRTAIAEALRWSDTGWPDFDLYAPILEAAPQARVFGAGRPAEEVRRAAEEGAAAAFGPDAAAYGLDLPLPPDEQSAREALLAAAHCDRLAAALLPGMVEAQRFRDASLADAALSARTMTGDGPVVVIAGSGHADRAGVPAALAIAEPGLAVFSLGQLEAPPADAGAFDAVLVAPAPEREDPCATLPARGE